MTSVHSSSLDADEVDLSGLVESVVDSDEEDLAESMDVCILSILVADIFCDRLSQLVLSFRSNRAWLSVIPSANVWKRIQRNEPKMISKRCWISQRICKHSPT